MDEVSYLLIDYFDLDDERFVQVLVVEVSLWRYTIGCFSCNSTIKEIRWSIPASLACQAGVSTMSIRIWMWKITLLTMLKLMVNFGDF